ncbi:MAG: hypothetical protein ABSB91_00350 [Sedimentisphaerales bacterium]|jgi:hypothetical protein
MITNNGTQVKKIFDYRLLIGDLKITLFLSVLVLFLIPALTGRDLLKARDGLRVWVHPGQQSSRSPQEGLYLPPGASPHLYFRFDNLLRSATARHGQARAREQIRPEMGEWTFSFSPNTVWWKGGLESPFPFLAISLANTHETSLRYADYAKLTKV